jgi:hypothetical protein
MSHIEFAGIFVGENMVVHFTLDINLNSSSWISSDSIQNNSRLICSSYPKCGFSKPNSGVVRSCLNCFLKEGSLHRYEYGACPFVFHAHLRGGTCTTAKSDPPAEVIQRASYLLESGFGNYNLFQNNCEDFALYCKTGLLTLDKIKTYIGKTGGSHQEKANKLGVGASGQVSSVSCVFDALLEAICGFGNYDLLQNNCEDFALYCKTDLLTVDKIKTYIGKTGGSHQKKANKLGVGASGQVSSVSSIFDTLLQAICSTLKLMPSLVIRATVMVVRYFLGRYAADIGVRDDVRKVAVEDLAVKLVWEGHHHEEVADDTEASKRHFVAMNSGMFFC